MRRPPQTALPDPRPSLPHSRAPPSRSTLPRSTVPPFDAALSPEVPQVPLPARALPPRLPSPALLLSTRSIALTPRAPRPQAASRPGKPKQPRRRHEGRLAPVRAGDAGRDAPAGFSVRCVCMLACECVGWRGAPLVGPKPAGRPEPPAAPHVSSMPSPGRGHAAGPWSCVCVCGGGGGSTTPARRLPVPPARCPPALCRSTSKQGAGVPARRCTASPPAPPGSTRHLAASPPAPQRSQSPSSTVQLRTPTPPRHLFAPPHRLGAGSRASRGAGLSTAARRQPPTPHHAVAALPAQVLTPSPALPPAPLPPRQPAGAAHSNHGGKASPK
jgi:hypothetical protein